jgi:Tol biopolymer transport system component
MALELGATFGPFVITDALGVGGMGEVYKATDTNLKREVAIKILPQVFVNDADRIVRFQREAEILASLSHPNIALVHGLERSDGAVALIMELVEGPTLAEHIARGPIPAEQALRVAAQICEALEYAHAKGVVHRDLKPANVKLSSDGRVKVLDFGLAKVVAVSETGAQPARSSGRAGFSTEPGTLFGTPAYMSPEQMRGGPVDKRTDIWAFGCVLFELLAGQSAFSGETKSDVCANVLSTEPNWNLLPAHTAPSVRRLLHRCLTKDVERRMRDIGDARLDLEESGDDQVTAVPVRRSRSGLVLGALAVAIVVVVALLAAGRLGRQAARQPEFRFELSTPPTVVPEEFAVSPDGSTVVSVGTSADGSSKLWLKEIGSSLERELAGTNGADWPFWSVDGRSVSFYAQGALRKYDLTTQTVQPLVDRLESQPFLGGTWNADGVLLIAPTYLAPIVMLRFGPGGPIESESRAVTKVDRTRGETGHTFPHFLPDGKHFLYYVNGSPRASGTYLGSLDHSVEKRLMSSDSTAVYSEPGRLLFVRGNKLYAQRFDLQSLTLSGEAFAVTDASVVNALGSGGMSASTEGTIVYRTGQSGLRRFVWRDAQGRELESVGEPIGGWPSSPELTAKGDGIVFQRNPNGDNIDVWQLEFGGGAPSRVTLEDGNEWAPIVSPVDDTLVYANYEISPKPAPTQLFSKPLSSNTVPGTPLLETMGNTRPMSYSADGRTILYGATWEPSYLERLKIPFRAGWDIWALSIDSKQTVPVAYTAANEWNGQFSPDQTWVAFESDESGIVEVYVQSFPDGKVKRKVSSKGGAQPRWFGDGSVLYLYFVDLDGVLYRTQVIQGAEKALVSFGPPQRLFRANIGPVTTRTYISKQEYLLDRRGRILTTEPSESSEPLRVARHWAGQPAAK